MMLAAPAGAVDLSLPASARLTVERNTGLGRFAAPVGVFAEGSVPMIEVDGRVKRAAWRLEAQGSTPLQVMRPLRAQLEAAGFDIVLDCADRFCGGFDFRFAIETLPGPNMYVNLRSFHAVTGIRGGGAEVVSILASTAATAAYVQVIQAGRSSVPAVGSATGGASGPKKPPDGFDERGTFVVPDRPVGPVEVALPGDPGQQLLARGHLVLRDLEFGTGSSDLGAGPFTSLAGIAAFLESRPSLRIAVVGHTDSVGNLSANIALSRQRALMVRQRLAQRYGLAEERMEAEGMGYLAPVASNLDPTGREANRRVEVILLSAE